VAAKISSALTSAAGTRDHGRVPGCLFGPQTQVGHMTLVMVLLSDFGGMLITLGDFVEGASLDYFR
jgi:hypothetical protein